MPRSDSDAFSSAISFHQFNEWDDDAFSLHTRHANEDPSDEQDDAASSNRSQNSDKDDSDPEDWDSHLVMAFQTSPVDLASRPAFAPSPWSRKFWSNFIAKISSPYAGLVVIWTAIIFYLTLLRDPLRADRQTGPAWISTSLIVFIVYVVRGTLHRQNQRLPQRTDRNARWLMCAWGLVSICLIGPALNLELVPRSSLTRVGIFYVGSDSEVPHDKDLAVLYTWEQVFFNLRGSLPSVVEDINDCVKDTLSFGMPDYPRTSFDRWIEQGVWEDTRTSTPNFMNLSGPQLEFTFNLPREGRGPLEDLWSNDHAAELSVIMPLWGVPKTFLSENVTRRVRHMTESLIPQFNCELADVVTRSQNKTTIDVEVKDSHGCTSAISLRSQSFDDYTLSTFQRGLDSFDAAVKRLNPSQAKILAELRLKRYRDLTSLKVPVRGFPPVWTPFGDLASDKCQERIAIVAFSDIALPEESFPPDSHVDALSCDIKFYEKVVYVELRSEREDGVGHFRNHGSHADQGKGFPNGFDEVRPYYEDKTNFPWRKLNPDMQKQLSMIFLHDATRFPLRNSCWCYPNLVEEFGDYKFDRPVLLGHLMMAIKSLRHSFLVRTSTAAALALQSEVEALSGPVSRFSGLDSQLQDSVLVSGGQYAEPRPTITEWSFLQSAFGFQAYLFSLAIIMTVLTVIYHYIPYITDDDLSRKRSKLSSTEVPWDISSIAARAAILRYSPIKAWLTKWEWNFNKNAQNELETMKIGHWRVHKKSHDSNIRSGWRLDSQNLRLPSPPEGLENAEHRSSAPNDQLHTYVTILGISTAFVGVAYLVLTMLGLKFMLAVQENPMDLKLQVGHVQRLHKTMIQQPFWLIFVRHLLPSSLVFFCVFCWLPFTSYFIYSRQQWVGLKESRKASQSITLDYISDPFALPKAIRNRNWLIVLLYLATIGSVLISLWQPQLYKNVVSLKSERMAALSNSFGALHTIAWRWTPDEPEEKLQKQFSLVMKTLLESLASWRSLPDWSSRDMGIIPLELTGFSPENGSALWYSHTKALQANMVCEEVPVNAVMKPMETSVKGVRALKLQEVIVNSHLGHQNFERHFFSPCSVPASDRSRHRNFFGYQYGVDGQGLCMRWWLHTNDNNPSSDPKGYNSQWLIVIVNGTTRWSYIEHETHFFETPSVKALACNPTIIGLDGAATLLSDDSSIKTAVPINFEVKGNHAIEPDLQFEINRGMNNSNNNYQGYSGGVVCEDSMVHSKEFFGDLLSYALYRIACVGRPTGSCWHGEGIRDHIAQIYATYVAILAGQSPHLITEKKETDQPLADIYKVQYSQHWQVNWHMFTGLCSFVILCMTISIYIFYNRNHFLLPISPEPLINGLALLSTSNIVDIMEKKIPNPHELSLKQFYKTVENWGYQYRSHYSREERKFQVVAIIEDDDTEGEGNRLLDITERESATESHEASDSEERRNSRESLWRKIRKGYTKGYRTGRRFQSFVAKRLIPAISWPIRKVIIFADNVGRFQERRRIQLERERERALT